MSVAPRPPYSFGQEMPAQPPDQRVNQERAQEAINTGADVLAVGCPFCMTMMEDGINARKGARDVRVMDVAELLWEAAQPRLADSKTEGVVMSSPTP